MTVALQKGHKWAKNTDLKQNFNWWNITMYPYGERDENKQKSKLTPVKTGIASKV